MRALIVDDQPLIVSGLEAVIAGFPAPIAVASAASADEARHLLASDSRFDLVLLDLELDGAGGLDVLAELRKAYPALSIVVLSACNSNELVSRAIFLGAMGFVFKRASHAQLVEALRLVTSGVVYVPPMSLRAQASPAARARPGRGDATGARRENASGGPSSETRRLASARGLTSRQTDVLELLLLGQSNKRIARALNLSVNTVKDHVTSLLRNFEVSSRTQAVAAWARAAAKAPQATDPLPFRGAAQALRARPSTSGLTTWTGSPST